MSTATIAAETSAMIAASPDPDAAFVELVTRWERARYGEVHSNSRHMGWAMYFGTAPGRLQVIYLLVALIADSEDRGATVDDIVRAASISRKLARQYAAELCELGLVRWEPDGLAIVCPVSRGTF